MITPPTNFQSLVLPRPTRSVASASGSHSRLGLPPHSEGLSIRRELPNTLKCTSMNPWSSMRSRSARHQLRGRSCSSSAVCLTLWSSLSTQPWKYPTVGFAYKMAAEIKSGSTTTTMARSATATPATARQTTKLGQGRRRREESPQPPVASFGGSSGCSSRLMLAESALRMVFT